MGDMDKKIQYQNDWAIFLGGRRRQSGYYEAHGGQRRVVEAAAVAAAAAAAAVRLEVSLYRDIVHKST